MSGKSSNEAIEDDLLVRRDAIMALFDPPIGTSAFNVRKNNGEFVSSKVRGFYLLNKTRKKLGMPPVDISGYRVEQEKVDETQLLRERYFLALTLVVPEALEVFTERNLPETLSFRDAETIQGMVKRYRDDLEVNGINDTTARLAFVGAALKALEQI